MADLVGNRYRLIRRLGVGGMGEVYAARDERLERDVAVKKLTFFSGSLEQLEMFTQRFKREAVSMAQFIHPYIVPVYDFGEEDGSLYLVMGLMTGGSLKEKMGDPMPVVEAAKTLIPIASALSYVHENGVIHRDVKPANILFNQRGTPMLADFGIVKLMESEGVTLTAAGTGVGTPAYMAPEQVTSDLDHRIDQYSLGVIFYELITGKRPYQGDTPMMTLIKHRTEPLPDPRQFVPDLSDDVVAVINTVLAKERDERYADMDAFQQALLDLVEKESTHPALDLRELTEDDSAEIAEQFVEEAVGEAVDDLADKVEERLAKVDAAAETQLSAPPPEEEEPVLDVPDAPVMEPEPTEEEPSIEEDKTVLDSKPVMAAPAVEEDATLLDSKPLVEEPAEEGATELLDAQPTVEEDATAIAAQPELVSESTELPPQAGPKNLIDLVDGATVFRRQEEDEDFDMLENGPTELLEDVAPTEIMDDGAPTEIMEPDVAPAPPEAVQKAARKKFPLWTIPVALVVIAGLVVGLLAILNVGPFAPEPTPTITYSSYEFDNEDDEPIDEADEPEPQPEPEEEEPAVVVPAGDNELSICFWDSATSLMEHLANVFYLNNPDVDIRLEELNEACNQEMLDGNFDFGLGQLSPEEKLLYPDATDYHIGYTSAFFSVHRDIGVEMVSWDDIYGIFSGEITNWSQLGGANVEIIPVVAEGTHPWIYVTYGVLGEGNWRDDMVYVDSLEEVEAFTDETYGAIGITGAREIPGHIGELGIDGVEVTYQTAALGEYPMQWANFLTAPVQWDDMGTVEQQFIEFIYSDEGWENIWVPKYVPWYKDFSESSVPEAGSLRIAGSTLTTDMMNETIARFMEQNPGWEISFDPSGGTPSLEALVNGEVDISMNGCTLGDTVEACKEYMEGMTGELIGFAPAFFWNHQDMDVWGLDWDTYWEILHGNITNWSEVGGPNEEIVIVVPDDQAPYYIIQDGFFEWEELPDHIIRVSNLDEVVGFIEENPNAMGIGGLHSTPEFIHWMRIDDIEIDEETLRSGEYPLRWTYLFLTDGPPDEFEQALLDFIYSEEGVQIRWDTGVIPNW